MEFHAKAAGGGDMVGALHQEFDNLLNYIAARDATVVDTAMKGLGTDDQLLVKILCNRSKPQIALIDKHYRKLPKNKSHTSLHDAVKSETSGNYGKFMGYITQSRGAFLSQQLSKAMDGIGCNKTLLNNCFTQSTTEDLAEMQRVYENMNGKKLADVIRSELSGEHEKLILYLLKNGRPQDPGDASKAEEQKKTLKDMIKNGGSMLGGLKDKAEEEISKYIAAMSAKQCGEVKKVYGKFEETIKDKFSGALEEAILQLMQEPDELQAFQLKEAMQGIGTDEENICRILGGNHKHVAAQISATFFTKYDKYLKDELASEIGGNFLNAVKVWIRGHDAAGGMEPTVAFYRKQFEAGTLGAGDIEVYCSILQTAIDNCKECIASLDCDLLKKAAKGIGTDERMVVSILCTRTKAQLDAVDLMYRERYGCSLRQYCEDELSGDLEEFLVYTQMEEDECDAHMLREAFEGIGCNENIVVEVCVGRTSERLAAAREYYEKKFDENIMDRLRSELGSDLEKLCLTLMKGCRNRQADQEPLSPSFDAASVAADLYKGGEGKWGTDEGAFIDALCSHSQAEMKAICDAYDSAYNCSLEKAIQSEFSGAMEDALIGLLYHPSDLYCRKLKKAMDGMGCDEDTVSRILGCNDKKDIHKIAQRYFERYDVQLVDMLSSELYYNYRHACMDYVSTSDVTDGMEDKLIAMTMEATDPPPKPPSTVENKPAPPPPAPKPPRAPSPPPPAPAPSAPTASGKVVEPQIVERYAPAPQPIVITFGVMDMEETRRQQRAQEERRREKEREKQRMHAQKEREREMRQQARENENEQRRERQRAERREEREERRGPGHRGGGGGGDGGGGGGHRPGGGGGRGGRGGRGHR